MLDLKFIRENPDAVRKGAKTKNIDIDVDAILALDEERRTLVTESEALKAEQNRASEKIAGEKDKDARQAMIDAVRLVKEKCKALEPRLTETEALLEAALRTIPNLPRPDVTIGRDDSENFVIRTFGEPTKFDFEPKDYMAIGESLDLIDTERAAKVAGARFGYLKNEAALLEFALAQYAFATLMPEGFVPVIPPVLVNEKVMGGMGYLDRGRDEVYHLASDNLFLAGTSEQSLGGMHMDETFEESALPRRYVGFSTCFRREAGS